MEFKLPIRYIEHTTVNPHVITDLELIQSEETPIYERVFSPDTEESTAMSHEWAMYYTTRKEFLEESISLFKTPTPTHSISEFRTHWNKIKNNSEFNITYQYVENKWLSGLNMSPSFLLAISIYFMTSPVLFLLSPFIMMIIPFVLLKAKGNDISWTTYKTVFMSVLKQHAIGGLITGFNEADTKQRAYLCGTAIFFCIQLYTNITSLITFSSNMNYIHSALRETKQYLHTTIQAMTNLQSRVRDLDTYHLFHNELESRKQVLEAYHSKLVPFQGKILQCGSTRALFYELYSNPELEKGIQYSLEFHGYLQNINSIHKRFGKKINPCTFSTQTSFVKAYYPTKRPVKNTYSLESSIILTGPNASGKTTLLKTTLINVLLSQQIGCGYYKSATISPYVSIQCYINIPDTSGRDSLFQAEARRCKEIINEAMKHENTLCIFDELFSGTNPDEARASATSLLRYLSEYPSFRFMLTTHFLEICKNLDGSGIKMQHMKTENGTYTYKLGNGVSYEKGALTVLEQLQFPEAIVKDARMRIN